MELYPLLVPAGNDTELQYNNGNLFGGDSALTWDDGAAKALTIGNCAVLGSDSALFQPNTDSTTFFQVKDAGGTQVGTWDTTKKRLKIGIGTPDSKFEVETPTVGDQYGIESHHTERTFAGPGYAFLGRCSISTGASGLTQDRGAFNVFCTHSVNDGRTNAGDQVGMQFQNTVNTFNTGIFSGDVFGLKLLNDYSGSGTRPSVYYQLFMTAPMIGTSNFAIYSQGSSTISYMEGLSGFGELAPETVIEITRADPYITLHNSTPEDTDGGKESRLNFKGEQSGGEETTLARIEVGHDGAADDEKGYWDLFVNDGSDGDSPTKRMRVESLGNWVISKTAGIGIKVDLTTPTFGFADLLGDQFSKNTGGTKPTLATYNGAVDAWQFSDGDEAFLTYHIPHDYVPGTDIHLHIHWSQTSATATGGTIDFVYSAIHAKGHNQVSGSTFTSTPITDTFSSIDINDGDSGLSQYQQHLTEVIISGTSATAALFDRDDFEPDGVIELTLEMDANNLTNSGAVLDPFIHYADIHYQTTGLIGTKAKAPDFYA